ncbi:hypothetical protein LTR85_007070 [Meristemomyces frigidus]|nr:hypothetical protein LTR85_007070 [Meristemomyces frigidus]
MAPDNVARFYWNKFKRARTFFDQQDLPHAQELCLQVIAEWDAPKHAHVQSYQLLSLCTNNYFDAKRFLEEANKILDGLDASDQLVQQSKEHTFQMQKELEDAWMAKWREIHGSGAKPPNEDEIETYAAEQSIGSDEQWAEEMKALHIASNYFREEVRRGGSPGAEEPWKRPGVATPEPKDDVDADVPMSPPDSPRPGA